MKYTKDQIMKAIKKWQQIAESITDKTEVKEDDVVAKKSIKAKIKEGIETIGSAASVAKSAAVIAGQVPEAIKLIRELTIAIERGAVAIEKLNASRGIK